MTSNMLENFRKYSTQFCLIFIGGFAGLYFLFQTSPVVNFHHQFFLKTFETSFSIFIPEVAITMSAENEQKPFFYSLDFYSKKELERKKEEARKLGQTTVNLLREKMTFDANYLTTVYLPFLIALFLATPLFWRKRLTATLIGYLFFLILVFFIFLLKIINYISSTKIGVYEFEGLSAEFLQVIEKISNAGFFSIMIVLIWITTLVLITNGNVFANNTKD